MQQNGGYCLGNINNHGFMRLPRSSLELIHSLLKLCLEVQSLRIRELRILLVGVLEGSTRAPGQVRV